jgi:hypothetical protein
MAHRLAVGDRGVATLHPAWLEIDRARLLTVGASLLGGQGLALLLKQGSEGALGQAAGCGTGDLFEGGEVDSKSGASIAEGAAGNDFAPLGGKFMHFAELFWS